MDVNTAVWALSKTLDETIQAFPLQSPDAECRGDETAPARASSVDISLSLFYGCKHKQVVAISRPTEKPIRKN